MAYILRKQVEFKRPAENKKINIWEKKPSKYAQFLLKRYKQFLKT